MGTLYAYRDKTPSIGAGTVLFDSAEITGDVVLHLLPDNELIIGDDAVIGPGAMIHGCRIGRGSIVEPGAIVCAGTLSGPPPVPGSIIGAGDLGGAADLVSSCAASRCLPYFNPGLITARMSAGVRIWRSAGGQEPAPPDNIHGRT